MCSNTISVGSGNIDSLSDQELLDSFDDVYYFCCSFVNRETISDVDPDLQCGVDFACLKKFFKRVTKHLETNKKSLHQVIADFNELIEHVIHADSANTDFIKTSVRGLFMLLMLPEMEHFDFFSLFEKVIRLLKHFAGELKKK